MRFKSRLAIAAGRAAGSLSRALRLGGGTSLPGAVALKIDPRTIGALARRLDQGSVVITATNGKTTTANMAADILSAAGLLPIHNAAGANLAYGIATALMQGAGEGDRPTIGLFEVDEATVKNVVPDLAPRVLAVGNIFRDQLDRFGEVDQTARLIAAGISELPEGARLVLNADDPRVAALGQGFEPEPLYFGIDDVGYAQSGGIGAQDSKDCLVCGGPLTYERRYFSHLGHYACPSCGFSRPAPQVTAIDLDLTLRGSRFKLVTPAGTFKIELKVPAIYNVYNALLATSVCLALGVEPRTIAAGLADFKPAFGRFEMIEVGGRRLHIMLIKNPTGFNQAIEALNIDARPKNIFFAINDNLADGTDVSWLWDADIENLEAPKWLLAGGIRAHDMALRLKYAGFDDGALRVEPDFDSALKLALDAVAPGDDLYILPTYTAMLEIRRRLQHLGGVSAFWKPGGLIE
ncbi:MAG: Mur ligase family protein [Actinomycetota bacterium]|nr:Mur ligase family protein [Actinomycetota bacterium]